MKIFLSWRNTGRASPQRKKAVAMPKEINPTKSYQVWLLEFE
jgi:hypothetical protein